MTIQISKAKDHIAKEVAIQGWMYNKRGGKGIYFLCLRDGSGFIQGIVAENKVSADVFKKAEELTMESSCKITGKITEHPKYKNAFEIQVSNIEIIQLCKNEYPISKKEHGPDFLLDNRHLWLRSQKQWAVQRVRDIVIQAIYDFFHQNGYIKIDTPIITTNACEGATTLFEIEYFDEGKAYLSQSGQLYLEAAIMSVGRGFDFGPTFRAEKSKTRRHLTEFWMMDAETAFMDHYQSMEEQENLICFIVEKCLEKCAEELKILERNIEPLKKIKTPFARLTYTETIKKLNKLGSDIKFGDDLGNDDEELLTKDAIVPIFINKWPKKIKPFYMKIDPENSDLVLNDDLIATENGGELIGGSQREDDYEILKASIKKENLQGPEYEWYLDLRKYGSVPHSGYGLGIERTVRWICGLHHIRETIPFPRTIGRVRP